MRIFRSLQSGIQAHPDSSQPGNRKGSKESVPSMTEHEESSFAFRRIAHKLCGMVMTINFILFWAVPTGMGGIWKFGLKHVLLPIYDLVTVAVYFEVR